MNEVRDHLIDKIEDLHDYVEAAGDVELARLLMAIVGSYEINRLNALIRLVKEFIDEEITDFEAYHN